MCGGFCNGFAGAEFHSAALAVDVAGITCIFTGGGFRVSDFGSTGVVGRIFGNRFGFGGFTDGAGEGLHARRGAGSGLCDLAAIPLVRGGFCDRLGFSGFADGAGEGLHACGGAGGGLCDLAAIPFVRGGFGNRLGFSGFADGAGIGFYACGGAGSGLCDLAVIPLVRGGFCNRFGSGGSADGAGVRSHAGGGAGGGLCDFAVVPRMRIKLIDGCCLRRAADVTGVRSYARFLAGGGFRDNSVIPVVFRKLFNHFCFCGSADGAGIADFTRHGAGGFFRDFTVPIVFPCGGNRLFHTRSSAADADLISRSLGGAGCGGDHAPFGISMAVVEVDGGGKQFLIVILVHVDGVPLGLRAAEIDVLHGAAAQQQLVADFRHGSGNIEGRIQLIAPGERSFAQRLHALVQRHVIQRFAVFKGVVLQRPQGIRRCRVIQLGAVVECAHADDLFIAAEVDLLQIFTVIKRVVADGGQGRRQRHLPEEHVIAELPVGQLCDLVRQRQRDVLQIAAGHQPVFVDIIQLTDGQDLNVVRRFERSEISLIVNNIYNYPRRECYFPQGCAIRKRIIPDGFHKAVDRDGRETGMIKGPFFYARYAFRQRNRFQRCAVFKCGFRNGLYADRKGDVGQRGTILKNLIAQRRRLQVVGPWDLDRGQRGTPGKRTFADCRQRIGKFDFL